MNKDQAVLPAMNPLTVRMEMWPSPGQTEIKESQVWEDGEQSQEKTSMREHRQRSCQCKHKGDTTAVTTCYHTV